ncbi:hypothetical protein [Paenibacillus apii]|uniref:hypothetical protein n=1 Tax=Paenibacillus apii TaxID=1850370 RepID=UPI002E28F0DC|nr:hypothetical protein [Paenibacillus apii]
MPKYRKKPVEIEAIQFTGSNWGEIETFVPVGKYNEDGTFNIVTLEGEHKCSIGDFVIQGVAGEFYPCKPEIFAATYEPADTTPVQPDTEEEEISEEDIAEIKQMMIGMKGTVQEISSHINSIGITLDKIGGNP